MSALRVAILAIVLVAGAAHAQSCPTATSAKLYANTSSTSCAGVNTCYTTYCNCLGLAHTSGLECAAPSPTALRTCANATTCTAAVMTCLNGNAESCANLKDLELSLMAVELGQLFNASLAYQACKYRSCMLVNASAGPNCTLDYAVLCKSPVVFRAVLALRGNFSGILADATKRESLALALEADLRRTLNYAQLWVVFLWIQGQPKGPKRPVPGSARQGNDVLLVEFEAPGVSAKNTNFKNALTTVNANSNWLTTTTSTLSTLGVAAPTVIGVAEGSGASAFSSGVLPPPPTPQPPTPVDPPTPQPPTATTAGAAMHSVLAAVVVALLSALMF